MTFTRPFWFVILLSSCCVTTTTRIIVNAFQIQSKSQLQLRRRQQPQNERISFWTDNHKSPSSFFLQMSAQDEDESNNDTTLTTMTTTTTTLDPSKLEEAKLLKQQAEKARLEAEKMDTLLTLEKITKLEMKLSSGTNKPEEEADIQKQLSLLQQRLEPKSPQITQKTSPTTTTTTTNGSSTKEYSPISEKELQERMDSFLRSPPVLQQMTAQAAGFENNVTDAEGIVRQMYKDEQEMKLKKELGKQGQLEALSQESKDSAIEGFEKLPEPIQDMIAKSVQLKNGRNATLVIQTLEAQNKLFEDENGLGGFEIDSSKVMDYFQEDQEFTETSRYVMSLLPEATRKESDTPTDDDIDTFFKTCCGKKTFNAVSKPERIPGGVLIRGENMMKTADEMIATMEEKLSLQPTIKDKLQIFFIRDPTPIPENAVETDVFESPLLIVTGKDVSPTTNGFVKPLVSTLGMISLGAFALGAYSFNSNIVDQLTQDVDNGNSDITWLTDLATQIFVTIAATQLAHEIAHQFVAFKDKFRAGLPTIVPSLQLGLQTSITPLLSPPKNFKSLFDFAISGPLVGIFLSIGLMYVGLETQVFMDVSEQSQLPSLPVELLRSSSLAGGIIEWLLGDGILLSPDPLSLVPLHPYAIAGFVGIMTNSLSLLPLGNTDGGRVATALFGRSFSRIVNGFTLLFLVLLGVFGLDESNVFLLYALFCTFFQREPEIPVKNEIDTIDEVRGVIAIASAVLVTLALCPITI